MTTIVTELEGIIGVSASDEPFVFALCLIPVLWVVKNVFGMLYSFLGGK